MGRIEEGETLRRVQGRDTEAGERAEAAVFTNPERRAIESRLHRALVDRVDGVARDAWAQALPGLRVLWSKEQYRGINSQWRFPDAEHGDTAYELIPVSAEEAIRIMERIRSSRTPASD